MLKELIGMVKKKEIKVQVTSNPDQTIEGNWNDLVSHSSENPFLLRSFVLQIMKSSYSTDYSGLVLVFSYEEKIIGIVPLMERKRFGVRYVKFTNKFVYSPDLIVDDKNRKILISLVLNFLFKNLNCKFVEFSLPIESPTFNILKEQCKAKGIIFKVAFEMGHRILPVSCSWNEFQSLRGKNFRQQFKKAEKKLDQAGPWKTVCVVGNEGTGVIERILDVERRSWKDVWRNQNGNNVDEDLMTILNASQTTAKNEPAFKWKVWFLELNGQTIAYLLVIHYKNTAYLTKTSFDEKYRKFYPGQFLRKSVIFDLFNEGQTNTIDFLTDLPHHQTWTSLCKQRVTITMAKGIIPNFVQSSFGSKFLISCQKRLVNRFFEKW